jgi:arginyl-tRNA synthetase
MRHRTNRDGRPLKDTLHALFGQALAALAAGRGVAAPQVAFAVERTRDPAHGDFACNAAMVSAKAFALPPRTIAQALIEALPAHAAVERLEIAGPGFINVFLAAGARQSVVAQVLDRAEG